MTLSLVNDTGQHDGTPTCRSGTSCRRPATILMKFAGRLYLPACDQCARLTYEHHPDLTTFAPLSEYVDMFVAAKAAALATPEQITGQRTIYCNEPSCEQGGQPNVADVIITFDNKHANPACGACAYERQAAVSSPLYIHQLDDRQRANYWRAYDAGDFRAIADPAQVAQPVQATQEPRPSSAGGLWVLGAAVLCFTIGGVACTANATAAGTFFILLSLIVGAMGIVLLAARSKRQLYQPSPSQPAASRRPGITAGDASLWGAGALATYDMHRRHQHARAEVQARSAAYRADVAQRQRDATQQAILGQLQQLNAGTGPADPVAALNERRAAANMRRPNPLVSNGWSQS